MSVRFLLAFGLACGLPALGFAEESKPSYSFQYSGLKYSSTNSSSKPEGGESTDTDTTALVTTGEDSYAWVTLDKWNFYVYPFTGGSSLGLSFMATEALELGSFIGLSSIGGDDKENESSATEIYPFLTYSAKVGDTTFENYLSLDIVRSSSKVNTGTELVDLKESSTGMTLLVTMVYPLAKNFFFVPSLKYGMASGTSKMGDQETKESMSGIAIAPIALRTTFD